MAQSYKETILKGNGQHDSQNSQSRAEALPALLSSSFLQAYVCVPHCLCHTFRVYNPHDELKEILETINKHRRISKLPRTKNFDHHVS